MLEVLVRVLAALVGFFAARAILLRTDIVLYPDVFPGRTYVDEDGVRYRYVKQPLLSAEN